MKDKLIKHKNKIIACAAVILLLMLAFFFGGRQPSAPTDKTAVATHVSTHEPEKTEEPANTAEPSPEPTEAPTKKPAVKTAEPKQTDKTPTGDTKYSERNGMVFDSSTGQDKYQTDPVPEGAPVPVEPQEIIIFEGEDHTCTLSVRCDTILDNMSLLDPEKRELVPSDGIIYSERTVSFSEGESVFDITLREMRDSKIHFEFTKTPVYNSAYIEGINNLYEFDCGELSGWQYRVNGWFPNYGCSRYQVRDGDRIEWLYTCDLGKDIGGSNYNE